jgi:hypothetical protein
MLSGTFSKNRKSAKRSGNRIFPSRKAFPAKICGQGDSKKDHGCQENKG